MPNKTTSLRRATGLTAALIATTALAGCQVPLIPDTSLVNPNVFVQQTAPVFYIPPYQDPPSNQPPPTPGAIPHKRQLYPTDFHQTYDHAATYGLPVSNPVYRTMYDIRHDDDHTLPAIPYSRIDPRFLRTEVDYRTSEAPGTIVVDTHAHYLYLVQPGGKAIRYGVGLGKAGFAWSGRGVIQRKAKWPR